jgi:hypothetical protein
LLNKSKMLDINCTIAVYKPIKEWGTLEVSGCQVSEYERLQWYSNK